MSPHSPRVRRSPRRYLAVTLLLATASAAPVYAGPPHSPRTPTGCTAVGASACEFVVSSPGSVQVTVFNDAEWQLAVVRHARSSTVEVDTDGCFGHTQITHEAYTCFVMLPVGEHVRLVVRTAGIVRAGNDVCALDPLCTPNRHATN